MIVTVTYGVKSSELVAARDRVAQVSGMKPIAREALSLGGDYYAFERENGDRLELLNNNDPIDDEPIYRKFAEWKFLLIVETDQPVTSLLQALDHASTHFIRLDTKTSNA